MNRYRVFVEFHMASSWGNFNFAVDTGLCFARDQTGDYLLL